MLFTISVIVCQPGDLYRSSLAYGFVLQALDPTLFLQVLHHRGHLKMAEVDPRTITRDVTIGVFARNTSTLATFLFIPDTKRRFTNPSSFSAKYTTFSCLIHHLRILFDTHLFNVGIVTRTIFWTGYFLHHLVLYYLCYNKVYIFYSLVFFQGETLQIPHNFPASVIHLHIKFFPRINNRLERFQRWIPCVNLMIRIYFDVFDC